MIRQSLSPSLATPLTAGLPARLDCHNGKTSSVFTIRWELPAAFEAVKPRLFGLAYRMLGSRAEAEDVVQEAYVRWHQADEAAIRNPEAWLVTTATRLAIDRLRALKVEREAYVGPWLPEPLIASPPPPDRDVELASDDLSIAFLVLLERLAPEERAAFLLHDVFDAATPEIAAAARQDRGGLRGRSSTAPAGASAASSSASTSPRRRGPPAKTFIAAVEARDEQTLLRALRARRHVDRRRRRQGRRRAASRSRAPTHREAAARPAEALRARGRHDAPRDGQRRNRSPHPPRRPRRGASPSSPTASGSPAPMPS